jgi:hypothetical protein
MRTLRLIACVVLLASCAPARSATSVASSPAHAAVVGVANVLFAAMEARDTSTLRSVFLPDARLVVVRVRDGMDPVIQSRGVTEFIVSVAQSPDVLRERMWNPQVEVDGDFASLWAPYEFHQAERLTHCGVDAFHLARLGGEWKIAALSYTVQTSSCPDPPGER